MKTYIYVGKKLDLPEFLFVRGTVYFGEEIEKLIEKYPLLGRLLIPVEDYPKINKDYQYFNSIVDELVGGRNGI
ncbi:hypothetical protein [Fusobacterium nucleatum]|uniref:hypothetical protein n=1 Tax=Fusobacterium nucleatum TaxID=851 RepID=UPI0030D2F343